MSTYNVLVVLSDDEQFNTSCVTEEEALELLIAELKEYKDRYEYIQIERRF